MIDFLDEVQEDDPAPFPEPFDQAFWEEASHNGSLGCYVLLADREDSRYAVLMRVIDKEIIFALPLNENQQLKNYFSP